MLKKIFLSLLALSFIVIGSCSLFGGYLLFHPEVAGRGIEWFTAQTLKSRPFNEQQDYFLQGIRDITIQSSSVPIELGIYDGDALNVEINGEVTGDITSLLSEQVVDDKLLLKILSPDSFMSFHLNINGQEYRPSQKHPVKAKILIPKKFKDKMTIQTQEAPVDAFLSDDFIIQLNLRSETGSVHSQWKPKSLPKLSDQTAMGTLDIQSERGNINVNGPL